MKDHIHLILLIIISLILVIGSFLIALKVVNDKLEENGKDKVTALQFFNNNTNPTFKTILIGMSFGFVFGFIDNAGLWFGLDVLEKYIPGGILTKAGWGNTYSDFLGSTLGTCIAIILKTLFPISDTPIWVDSFGVVVGCIFGIYIPQMITGKN